MSFLCIVFFLQKKTANKMRISDWSSDVCFSDQPVPAAPAPSTPAAASPWRAQLGAFAVEGNARKLWKSLEGRYPKLAARQPYLVKRSEEHTSELQSLMRISYAVFCLKKKKKTK